MHVALFVPQLVSSAFGGDATYGHLMVSSCNIVLSVLTLSFNTAQRHFSLYTPSLEILLEV